MQVTISRDDLAKSLAAVARVVARRSTIPILSNVLLDAQNNALSLNATDLDRQASARTTANVSEPGTTTVSGKILGDIVSKFSSGAITIETKDENHIIVKCGRSRFTLPTLPAEDFPNLAADGFSTNFEISAKNIAEHFGYVEFAISTEETRYYLNGIFWHRDTNGNLAAVATDGHRLAKNCRAHDGIESFSGIIVPTETVGEVLRMAKNTETFTVEISDKAIRFSACGEKSNDAILTSKLIDGTFPDYTRVIPADNQNEAVVAREPLMQAVDRVRTVAAETNSAVKMSFDPAGTITLTVRSPDTGEAIEEVEVEYSGPSIDIGFNASYLMDILQKIQNDKVLIRMNDAGSPTLFLPAIGDDCTIVLMPMRV